MNSAHRISMFQQQLICLLLSSQVVLAQNIKSPPRLNGCREVLKAKDAGEVYLMSTSYSCQNVTFPCLAPAFPDTRNCENYYVCESMTLAQCPCPTGQTFNTATLKCDSTQSPCSCTNPIATTTTLTTTANAATTTTATSTGTLTPSVGATTAHVISKDTQTEPASSSASPITALNAPLQVPVVEALLPSNGITVATTTPSTGAAGGSASRSYASTTSSDVRNETSIIIAAIACGSAVTVAIIGTVVYLYQRGRFRPQKDAKLGMLSCGETGYVHTASTERHVYDEIDDRTMSSMHNSSYQTSAPPLPTSLPPQHLPCVHCLDETDIAAAAIAVAKRQFPHTNPYVRYDRTYDKNAGASEARLDDYRHSRESSSDCSLYSGSSSLSSPESIDNDMRAPLQAYMGSIKNPYVSKQVYI